jgi:hypothetical protein
MRKLWAKRKVISPALNQSSEKKLQKNWKVVDNFEPREFFCPYLKKILLRVWDRIPVGTRFFDRPDRPLGPPSLL